MVLSEYVKLQILGLHWKGCKISTIKDIGGGNYCSKQSIRLFLKRLGTIGRKPGSGMTLKLSSAILQIIEDSMRNDDEITATQL